MLSIYTIRSIWWLFAFSKACTPNHNEVQHSTEFCQSCHSMVGVNNFVDFIKHRLNLHIPGGNKALGKISELRKNQLEVVWPAVYGQQDHVLYDPWH